VTTAAPPSNWAELFRIARALIRQVNAERCIIDHWSFGGGTAMMLQIDHRESHDVDIFLHDPQFLAFLDPQIHDFDFAIRPTDYTGDGRGFLKLVFKDLGQIDFIVGRALTSSPTVRTSVEGETVFLETIPEIIVKKIHHRGSSIRPRDIFDVAASAERHADSVVQELRGYREDVRAALNSMDALNPDFVHHAVAELAIRDAYRPVAEAALERAKALLRNV
jgi:hypothetical protein